MSDKPMRVLSLGAGVQSSTLALMIAEGEIPMVDCAIFADTGAEPKAVYDWLDELERRLPFPIHRCMHKEGLLENIRNNVKYGTRFAGAPFYAASPTRDKEGMLRRQCTREFKVMPITQKIRELLGLKKGERAGKAVRVIQYIGISLDEAIRMKPSRDKWIEHQWPLIDRRMSRHDCNQWLAKRGIHKLPKSACSFCPYHSNAEWRYLRDEQPDAWQEAIEVDELIRHGVKGTTDALYVHQSLVPLKDVDLRTDLDKGQMSLWGNECEGMCGV